LRWELSKPMKKIFTAQPETAAGVIQLDF